MFLFVFFFSFRIINTHFTAISHAFANVSSLSAGAANNSKTPTAKATVMTTTTTTVTAVAFTGHWPIVDDRSFQGLRTRGTRCCCCCCGYPTANGIGSIDSDPAAGIVFRIHQWRTTSERRQRSRLADYVGDTENALTRTRANRRQNASRSPSVIRS